MQHQQKEDPESLWLPATVTHTPVILLSCFVDQPVPSLSHDLLPGKRASGRGGQTWLPWKRSHLVSPELRSTPTLEGEKTWKIQNPRHLPNDMYHCEFENKMKIGNLVCHILKPLCWEDNIAGRKDGGFGLWRRLRFRLPSTICWHLGSLLFPAHHVVLFWAVSCFVHAKSKPTENTPKRNSVEGSEIVLDPSENWWIYLLDCCFSPCAGG